MCLGNLFTKAGYNLIEAKAYFPKWPPKYRFLARILGKKLFEIVCRIYGRFERHWFQVRAVAEKPHAQRCDMTKSCNLFLMI